jgi:hypothetical protein
VECGGLAAAFAIPNIEIGDFARGIYLPFFAHSGGYD